MLIIITKNYGEMSKKAAEIILEEVNKKPNLTIGFATGETPTEMYKLLIKAYKKKKVDFSKIKTFNLDEYYPIKRSDKNSYYYYMFKHFFSKIDVKKSNLNFLNGETKNPIKECSDYEEKIKKNPIDMQILGVGINGHIGFNEPGSSFNSRTRIVDLSYKTIMAISKFFKNINDIPKKALTVGISTIISAKKIILLASGKDKASAIKCLIDGKIISSCPVSFLKKHRNLIVIIDKKAGSLLN